MFNNLATLTTSYKQHWACKNLSSMSLVVFLFFCKFHSFIAMIFCFCNCFREKGFLLILSLLWSNCKETGNWGYYLERYAVVTLVINLSLICMHLFLQSRWQSIPRAPWEEVLGMYDNCRDLEWLASLAIWSLGWLWFWGRRAEVAPKSSSFLSLKWES